ncbi:MULTISPECIES: MFS transporter [Bacillota]|uniref:MFS transporter n=1 Tax=Amedibacillus hominis TaxID=2897776 RepID=A0ABS9R956_9FIRM|nr:MULTISPECIES: MFS transporter [Bacillota]MCH4286187.1 MFS transporter [Amedibacillus hominis]
MKKLQLWLLAFGVFGIINTEMGIIGILPNLAKYYHISLTDAGLFVSLFALAVAISGPIMPLLCSGMKRKKALLMVLSIFAVCNLISIITSNFMIALCARVLPAFFHPVFISFALSMASASVEEKAAPKAVSKVMLGVSGGMVIGVPIVNMIADITDLRMAMLFFALANIVSLLMCSVFLPADDKQEKISYGKQLTILKRKNVWLSIFGVICLNGSIFGVYSYISEYLIQISGFSSHMVSMILLIYGLANMVGNTLGGKWLSETPLRLFRVFPIALIFLYMMQYVLGSISWICAGLMLVWGILAGCGGMMNQYWITKACDDAPAFGNGLFLSATNLGTTIATSVCGMMINTSIPSIFLGGMIFICIALAVFIYQYGSQMVNKKIMMMEES